MEAIETQQTQESEEAALRCCGKEWPWFTANCMDMTVHERRMALCAVCGNFRTREEGLLDAEGIWNCIGTDEDDITELLATRHPLGTREEIARWIDEGSKEYVDVVRELYGRWAQ